MHVADCRMIVCYGAKLIDVIGLPSLRVDVDIDKFMEAVDWFVVVVVVVVVVGAVVDSDSVVTFKVTVEK